MFLVRAVNYGGAAHLWDLLSVSIEGPAADLLAPDDVLHEQDATVESQRQLVKQLDVLQQVVVRIAENNDADRGDLKVVWNFKFIKLKSGVLEQHLNTKQLQLKS